MVTAPNVVNKYLLRIPPLINEEMNLFRADRLALSAGWIVLGVLAYYALERLRARDIEDATAAGIEPDPAEEGDD
jgi:hypothetical protein